MAHLLGAEIEKVVKQGPELVFILYPQIFANLPLPPLWAALFFLTLVMLGIDSQFGNVEVVVTTIADSFDGRMFRTIFKGSCFTNIVVLFVLQIIFIFVKYRSENILKRTTGSESLVVKLFFFYIFYANKF